MPKAPSASDSQVASNLAAQLRTSFTRLKRRLREQGARGDLKPSQVAVVLRLESEGAVTVSGLARAEGMRPQSMSSIIVSLQELGLVDSAPDPSDGRQTLMSLSRKCETLLRYNRAAKQDWLTNAIRQKLSVPEQEKVLAALELLNRVTEDGPLS
jgi:DNA-binding MarR family transcriptional regulator